MSEPIRIIIADDHTMVRQGIRVLLETDPRMRVVGEAADGLEAVECVEEHDADVVLMDLRMPRLNGISALREILRRDPRQAVIILTTFDEDALMREALEAGARGYLLKDMTRETLLRTVEAAAHGGTLLEPDLLARILSARADQTSGGTDRAFWDSAPPEKRQPAAEGSPLTERERDVLRAIAAGNTSRSAAAELGIAERTVKAHLTSVFNKLGVDTRAAAIAFAVERGWL
jgi:two-component system, NarL family, response regulator YdfI